MSRMRNDISGLSNSALRNLLSNNGYEEFDEILKLKDVNGENVMILTEFELRQWKLPPPITRKLWLCLSQLRESPHLFSNQNDEDRKSSSSVMMRPMQNFNNCKNEFKSTLLNLLRPQSTPTKGVIISTEHDKSTPVEDYLDMGKKAQSGIKKAYKENEYDESGYLLPSSRLSLNERPKVIENNYEAPPDIRISRSRVISKSVNSKESSVMDKMVGTMPTPPLPTRSGVNWKKSPVRMDDSFKHSYENAKIAQNSDGQHHRGNDEISIRKNREQDNEELSDKTRVLHKTNRISDIKSRPLPMLPTLGAKLENTSSRIPLVKNVNMKRQVSSTIPHKESFPVGNSGQSKISNRSMERPAEQLYANHDIIKKQESNSANILSKSNSLKMPNDIRFRKLPRMPSPEVQDNYSEDLIIESEEREDTAYGNIPDKPLMVQKERFDTRPPSFQVKKKLSPNVPTRISSGKPALLMAKPSKNLKTIKSPNSIGNELLSNRLKEELTKFHQQGKRGIRQDDNDIFQEAGAIPADMGLPYPEPDSMLNLQAYHSGKSAASEYKDEITREACPIINDENDDKVYGNIPEVPVIKKRPSVPEKKKGMVDNIRAKNWPPPPPPISNNETINQIIQEVRTVDNSTNDAAEDELEDYETSVFNLNNEEFYRKTDRKGAKVLLKDLEDGAFLFRPSYKNTQNFFLTLQIKNGSEFYNLGIEKTANNKLRCHTEGVVTCPQFNTLDDFITHFSKKYLTFRNRNNTTVHILLKRALPSDRF